MSISIFIVDDHYMVLEGIRSLLQNESSLELLGHASSAASCLSFLKLQVPDVILMDINMPNMSGLELCKVVKELYPSVHIIGLSTFNQFSFIDKMMANGASGYVLKNATPNELVEAITTVMEGKIYLSIEAAQTLRKPDSIAVTLTRREKEVLTLIAEGFTNHEIAAKLFLSNTTIDSHRKNLLTKFNCRNIASLISIATKSGIL